MTAEETQAADTSAEDTEAQELLAQAAEADAEDAGQDDTGADEGETDGGKQTGQKPEAGKARKVVDQTEFVKVVKERQAAKKQLKDMQAQLDELKRANEDESEKAKREAAEKATKEIESKYKPIVVRTSARAALVGAGVAEEKVPRLIKLMDLEEIEVGDDGEVSGVTEQVAALQEDYPELFAQPEPEKPKPRTAKAADGADKTPARKKESTSELLLRGLRGR